MPFAVAGQGPPVLFLHGWGLTPHTYRPAVERLADNGVQVFAPVLPGFGGTTELPPAQRNLPGYARWVEQFLDAAGIDEPVTIVGHSFGGGIAIQSAHDLPRRVARLVLVNSVGGGAWAPRGQLTRSIRERPLRDWAASGVLEALSAHAPLPVMASMTTAAVANLLRNPRALWRSAQLARFADLRRELDELANRNLPVALIWGHNDKVIPPTSFQSMTRTLRHALIFTVAGTHGWLISDPDTFGDVTKHVFAAWSAQDAA
ncbi:alpha/beta fold hydrolase [Rhodococcus erythropolis]|uniref:alpha/beta fold hydrolase n=1 Tax=Rhodococcus erythropolis TaxID=1833 RepID=UPI00294A8DB5|nr:alpha/beta fold hydrolase [Rhodococcus erythropolis]MDV6278632.1 alpha/beta fold hydrolase [Rhodococcus erythropolis]